MIHSFRILYPKNGNLVVEFFDDNRRRQIIFTKNTDAKNDMLKALSTCKSSDSISDELLIKKSIELLRVKYTFRKNPDNVSIFRPFQI